MRQLSSDSCRNSNRMPTLYEFRTILKQLSPSTTHSQCWAKFQLSFEMQFEVEFRRFCSPPGGFLLFITYWLQTSPSSAVLWMDYKWGKKTTTTTQFSLSKPEITPNQIRINRNIRVNKCVADGEQKHLAMLLCNEKQTRIKKWMKSWNMSQHMWKL